MRKKLTGRNITQSYVPVLLASLEKSKIRMNSAIRRGPRMLRPLPTRILRIRTSLFITNRLGLGSRASVPALTASSVLCCFDNTRPGSHRRALPNDQLGMLVERGLGTRLQTSLPLDSETQARNNRRALQLNVFTRNNLQVSELELDVVRFLSGTCDRIDLVEQNF
jgi:hypothetical protein